MKEWRCLSAGAKIFYWHLKARYNGTNNGEIRLSYRAMKDVKGCSNPRTISHASKELQKKGWLKVEERGGLYRHNNLYKLTFKYDLYGCENNYLVAKHRDKNKQKMKKNKKHFLEKNSYTRYNVHAILDTTSAKMARKALIGGGQLYYIQRQGFPDVVLGTSYLYIYQGVLVFCQNPVKFIFGEMVFKP